jgi:hypothetical protein
MSRNGHRTLTTFDEVVEELGGTGGLGRLVEQDSAAVCNWRRRRGRFPAKYYPEMMKALNKLGCDAPLDLWGFYKRDMADAA